MNAVSRALSLLGIDRLVLGVHDPCFPETPGEDVGRGTPYAPSGHALATWARELGFTGLQLGPQGEISEANASPYDGTVFSRGTASIALGALARDPLYAPLLDDVSVPDLAFPGRERADHVTALRIVGHALNRAATRLRELRDDPRGRAIAAHVEAFRRTHAAWIEADALWEALAIEHGGADWSLWTDDLDRRLLQREDELSRARVAALRATHANAIDRFVLGQAIVHAQHDSFRARCRALGLSLYGDLQIGWSRRDLWAHQDAFLRDFRMGAPPSRTNPDGQPWGYPVLDPLRRDGADRLVAMRIEKTLAEYDGVRIDHPHGLVCPWVYRVDDPDPLHAVQNGARLFDSPDVPEHPELARYAIARPDQIDRTKRRWDDGWVRALEDAQVERYAVVIDRIIAAVRAAGGAPQDVACEVLSTMPYPLARVMARHGLGRFRVTQKVGLDDPRDVYRSENAAPEDWVMVGNHDTPPVWRCARTWVEQARGEAHAAYLATRLCPDPAARGPFVERLARDPSALARAKLAELFVGPARNVFVWWADLFGEITVYNRPGVVDPANWSLRIPRDFRRVHAERAAAGTALDLRAALATALRARGLDREHRALVEELSNRE